MPWGTIIMVVSKFITRLLNRKKKGPTNLMDPFLMDLTDKVKHVIGRFDIIPKQRTIINTDRDLRKFVEYLDNIGVAQMSLDKMTGTITTSSIITQLANNELIEFLNFSNTSYDGAIRRSHMISEMIRILPRYRHEDLENIIVTKTMVYRSRIESSVTERFEFVDVSYAHLVEAITDHFINICKDTSFADKMNPDTLDKFNKHTCVIILTKFADVEFTELISDEIVGDDTQLLVIIEGENLLIDITDKASLIDALEIYKYDTIAGLYTIHNGNPVWKIKK